MKWKSLAGVSVIILVVLSFTGCDLIEQDSNQTGSLAIQFFDNVNARSTMTPDYDMEVDSYRVSGTGPGERLFGPVTVNKDGVESSYTVENLFKGNWTILVEALNEDEDVIGEGTSSATLIVGETVTASIEVSPLSGLGTLDLAIDWNPDSIDDPNIFVYLTREGEEEGDPLDVDYDGDKVTFTGDFEAGYYELRVIPKDGEDTVTGFGFVRVVRIVPEKTTFGEFYLNIPKEGNVAIGIIDRLNNPFEVDIDPDVDELVISDMETGTFSVTPNGGGYSYTWYISGEKLEGEDSHTLEINGEDYSPGWYNVDVKVTNPLGVKSSGTSSFTVTFTQPFIEVTLTDTDDESVKILRFAKGPVGSLPEMGIENEYDGESLFGLLLDVDDEYIVMGFSEPVDFLDAAKWAQTGDTSVFDDFGDFSAITIILHRSQNTAAMNLLIKEEGVITDYQETYRFVDGEFTYNLSAEFNEAGLNEYMTGALAGFIALSVEEDVEEDTYTPTGERQIEVSFRAFISAEITGE